METNPGPRPSQLCNICDRKSTSADGVQCVLCSKRYHRLCVSVNNETALETQGNWVCQSCYYPCGICYINVLDSDKAICCDKCDSWVHIACGGVTDAEYDKLINSDNDANLWNCPKCDLLIFDDSLFDNSNLSSKSSDTDNQTPKQGMKAGKLSCLLVNCRSVKGKVADIQALIEEVKPDMVCGTESWLNSEIGSSEIFPSNYLVFRKDRITDTSGGGVFQAIRQELVVSHRADLDSKSEVLWTEIQLKNQKSLITGVFYRTSEDKTGVRIDELENSILKIGKDINKNNVLIVGDFNLPNIDRENKTVTPKPDYSTVAAEKLVGIIDEHGLQQLVDKPTRVTETSSSILDLVMVNNINMVRNVTVDIGISDHDTVQVDLSFIPKIKRKPRRMVFLRDIKPMLMQSDMTSQISLIVTLKIV